jgi:predicted RNA-binding Zn-ribbon protein involved in translation (DUF1610 family)
MKSFTCLNCHYTLDSRSVLEACPNCGSVNRTINSIEVADIEIFPCVSIKVENPTYQGRHKYARETKTVAEHSVTGHLVRVAQTIDRRNNRYREKVTDVETGEVTREVDHPLSEHTGHGSDNPGRRRD